MNEHHEHKAKMGDKNCSGYYDEVDAYVVRKYSLIHYMAKL